ncbi:MAG: response regulator [Deltaproteobacteria bacterium]|nr:response regulator [Deltaproteobacteria bacterium]MBI3018070.1 response regulator [Deltaproteobacteria bacterium]
MPKVLLIDDSKTIQKVARLILQGTDFSLLTADTRQKGEELALKEKPHIALIDLTLGESDGLGLIQSFKARPETSGIKVALLYSHYKKIKDDVLLQAGADGKLAKPFNSEEFLALLRELRTSNNMLDPQPVVPMPPDPFKSLFDEEELDKHLEFLEKPLSAIPQYSDDGKRLDSLPRETVEKVCREIIPPLAEKIIREEIQKLLKDKE